MILGRTVRPTVKIAGAAVLAPLAVILQVLPPIFLTPWFMRIDLVAVPWVICWVLFGFKAALLSLLISAPLVGLLGPFAGGWVGAVMKSAASIWMFAIPALFAYVAGGASRILNNRRAYLVAVLFAIVVRDIVTVIFNLHFAIPVFFGMTPEQTIEFFTNPRFQSFIGRTLGLIGLGAYITEVTFWNTVQGILDGYVSYGVALTLTRRGLRGQP